MTSDQSVETALSLADQIARRPFLDRSPELLSSTEQLRSVLQRVDESRLPRDRVSAFNAIVRQITRHGGIQLDHELTKLMIRLKEVLSWYWGDLRRRPEIVLALLRHVEGEAVDLSRLTQKQIAYHQSVLFQEGLVEGDQVTNGDFVTRYNITRLTDAGRRLLSDTRTNGHVRERAAMPSVFISHASDDLPLVTALVDLIRTALSIEPHAIRASSMDGARLPGGADTSETLRDEVLHAPAFIALITPASQASTWVMFELGARWGSGKLLIPLLSERVSTSDLKGPLTNLSALSSTSMSQLHQMLDELAETLAIPKRSPAIYTEKLESLIRLAHG